MRQSRLWIGMFLGVMMGCLLSGSWFIQQARQGVALAQEAKAVERWEYNVLVADAAVLQLRLVELSNDRWEPISIVPSESVVDSGQNAQARLRVERYQITSRRTAR